jgi:hypothetical protein
MNQTLILYPMLTLVGLAMTILAMVGMRRVVAVQARHVKPQDFALGESAAVPPAVALPNRNFMNLMEVPVLFYVVCLTYYVTQRVDTVALVLAWLFVAARGIHSVVHLTYNKVLHRLVCFATANFLLIVLWVHLLLKL